MEGIIQGWEQDSGRISVQVQSKVVQVWPGELVRLQEQEGQSGGERKRRTLEEPDTAAGRAKEEVKRARTRGVREPGQRLPRSDGLIDGKLGKLFQFGYISC